MVATRTVPAIEFTVCAKRTPTRFRDFLRFSYVTREPTNGYLVSQGFVLSTERIPDIRQGEIFSLAEQTPKRAPADAARTRTQGKDRDMGSALRSIYQKTVEESVPSEMLDLLGKLD